MLFPSCDVSLAFCPGSSTTSSASTRMVKPQSGWKQPAGIGTVTSAAAPFGSAGVVTVSTPAENSTRVVVATKVRSFGQGIDGEIYVVAAGAPVGGLGSASPTEAGTLYRIDPM